MSINIIKEKNLEKYLTPVSLIQTEIILKQMKTSICKICLKDGSKGTGFFCRIPFPNQQNLLEVLITNNHVVNQSFLNKEDNLVVKLFNDKDKGGSIKNIKLNNKMKYTNDIYDITIIEIKRNIDEIYNFLDLDINIMEDNSEETYTANTIYLLGYPKSEDVKASYGIINNIELKKVMNLIIIVVQIKVLQALLYSF